MLYRPRFRNRVALYANGRLATEREDRDGDGRIDRLTRYDAEERVVQRDEDQDGDGLVDARAFYEAGRLVPLGTFHTSKSILREVAYLYLADDLRPASRPADHTEFIERRTFPFTEVLRMVERGEIMDSMTIVAVLHAARRR